MTASGVDIDGEDGTSGGLDLSPAVAQEHRRIDTTRWDDIYVVGDPHGCLGAVERLFDRLEFGPSDLVVFVGDLVRKGPDSQGVLDLVRDQDNVVSVRGNNEQGLIDGDKTAPDLGPEDVAFVESLPVVVSFDDVAVVHGGIDHRKPLRHHDTHDLLTTRSLAGGGYERPYWFEQRRETPRVCFGHTVLSEPFATPYAVGLDTGCVYGGELTAYDYGSDRFVSVDAGTTYQSRPEDKFVSPAMPTDGSESPPDSRLRERKREDGGDLSSGS
jgi:serine/threonine protein phosphatase 1